MNGENPTEEGRTETIPAVARLEALAEELENCLKQSAGKNAEWENRVKNKIFAIEVAIQTVQKYEDLPKETNLNILEKLARELVSQRP